MPKPKDKTGAEEESSSSPPLPAQPTAPLAPTSGNGTPY
jgi:hypothetical protein